MPRRKSNPPMFGIGFLSGMLGLIGIVYRREASAIQAERDARDALDKLEIAKARAKMIEAQTRLIEERVKQTPEQTRGITERYRLTQENRVNSMIRQMKQEEEILRLKLQIRELQQRLGPDPQGNTGFKPERWEEK